MIGRERRKICVGSRVYEPSREVTVKVTSRIPIVVPDEPRKHDNDNRPSADAHIYMYICTIIHIYVSTIEFSIDPIL